MGRLPLRRLWLVVCLVVAGCGDERDDSDPTIAERGDHGDRGDRDDRGHGGGGHDDDDCDGGHGHCACTDGVDCWDLDGDHHCDAAEDVDGSGSCDASCASHWSVARK